MSEYGVKDNHQALWIPLSSGQVSPPGLAIGSQPVHELIDLPLDGMHRIERVSADFQRISLREGETVSALVGLIERLAQTGTRYNRLSLVVIYRSPVDAAAAAESLRDLGNQNGTFRLGVVHPSGTIFNIDTSDPRHWSLLVASSGQLEAEKVSLAVQLERGDIVVEVILLPEHSVIRDSIKFCGIRHSDPPVVTCVSVTPELLTLVKKYLTQEPSNLNYETSAFGGDYQTHVVFVELIEE